MNAYGGLQPGAPQPQAEPALPSSSAVPAAGTAAPGADEPGTQGRDSQSRHPAQDLAEGLAVHVRRWSLARQADSVAAETAGRAAHALSLASSAGHVCLPLAVLAGLASLTAPGALAAQQTGSVQHLRRRLLASAVVGTQHEPGVMPLVLDDANRLYLQRSFEHEAALARRLLQAAALRFEPAAADGAATSEAALTDEQAQAVAQAAQQGLTLISGGPGTGKTSTVLRLLLRLLQDSPHCRIALAAPTGKAAARLLESITQRASSLPAAVQGQLPAEAFTVHRLLGASPAAAPGHGGFTHHEGNPLPLDVLVLDEASMLDLALARRLLCALPAQARIIMLGDAQQLAAVEAGAVFAELCAPLATPAAAADDETGSDEREGTAAAASSRTEDRPAAPEAAAAAAAAHPLAAQQIHLTHSHRFDDHSGIGRLAHLINSGRAQAALQLLRADSQRADAALSWRDTTKTAGSGADTQAAAAADTRADTVARAVAEAASQQALHTALVALYTPYLQALLDTFQTSTTAAPVPAGEQAARLHAAFARARVLCAQQLGPQGVWRVNEWLSAWLRQQLPPALAALSATSSPWYVGRPVLIQRNHRLLGLSNGDVGLVMPASAAGAKSNGQGDGQGEGQRHGQRPSGVGGWAGANGLVVSFPAAATRPGEAGGWRVLAPARLPAHDTAFAMTVHKAQGSEFDAVLLLLPALRGAAGAAGNNPLLTRELLYTAVTRARQRVTLHAPAAAVALAIGTPTRREGGLLDRLRQRQAGC